MERGQHVWSTVLFVHHCQLITRQILLPFDFVESLADLLARRSRYPDKVTAWSGTVLSRQVSVKQMADLSLYFSLNWSRRMSSSILFLRNLMLDRSSARSES